MGRLSGNRFEMASKIPEDPGEQRRPLLLGPMARESEGPPRGRALQRDLREDAEGLVVRLEHQPGRPVPDPAGGPATVARPGLPEIGRWTSDLEVWRVHGLTTFFRKDASGPGRRLTPIGRGRPGTLGRDLREPRDPHRASRDSPLGRGSTAPTYWSACGPSLVTGGSNFFLRCGGSACPRRRRPSILAGGDDGRCAGVRTRPVVARPGKLRSPVTDGGPGANHRVGPVNAVIPRSSAKTFRAP